MFWNRKKSEKVPLPGPPDYVYDIDILFKDGHTYEILEADTYYFSWGKSWLVVDDDVERETKYIQTTDVESITITKKVLR